MNKMKQLIFVLIGFIIAVLVIGIMLNFTKNDLVNQVSESNERTSSAAVKEKEEKDNTLVFLCLYSEPGDSQLFSGYAVNKNGNRFDINLNKSRDISQYKEIFADAQKDLDNMTAKDFIGTKEINNLCELLDLIKPIKDYKIETDKNGVNGTTVVYGIKYDENGKADLIKIGRFGDTKETPSDTNAKSVLKYFSAKGH